MFEVFKNYLNGLVSLSDEQYELIRSVAVQKRVRKKQFLLQEGEIWDSYIFVCSGCLRQFRVDHKNAEWTLYFALEKWWLTDPESRLSNKPTIFNIDALEDSVVLIFKKHDFDSLKKAIPEFSDLIELLAYRNLIAIQNRLYDLVSKTAEERYSHLIATHPVCINRAPLHMIASYLGLSPFTISRIRNQIVRS